MTNETMSPPGQLRGRRIAAAMSLIGSLRLVLYASTGRLSELLGGAGLILIAASFLWAASRHAGAGGMSWQGAALPARIVGILLVAVSFIVMMMGPVAWPE